jgi:hypothetical protein
VWGWNSFLNEAWITASRLIRAGAELRFVEPHAIAALSSVQAIVLCHQEGLSASALEAVLALAQRDHLAVWALSGVPGEARAGDDPQRWHKALFDLFGLVFGVESPRYASSVAEWSFTLVTLSGRRSALATTGAVFPTLVADDVSSSFDNGSFMGAPPPSAHGIEAGSGWPVYFSRGGAHRGLFFPAALGEVHDVGVGLVPQTQALVDLFARLLYERSPLDERVDERPAMAYVRRAQLRDGQLVFAARVPPLSVKTAIDCGAGVSDVRIDGLARKRRYRALVSGAELESDVYGVLALPLDACGSELLIASP